MNFEWSKLFPEADDLQEFRNDLYSLARAMYDLTECPQAYEDQVDFIVKICQFVKNNECQIEYIQKLLEEEDESNNFETGNP